MELTMAAQEDARPWAWAPDTDHRNKPLHGRGHFSQLGFVRTKPCKEKGRATMNC